MIPASIVLALTPVSPLRALPHGRPGMARALDLLEPGDLVSARVGARLADGSFAVTLGDETLRMPLPGQRTSGETIELTLLARNPHLTFSLGAAPSASPDASLSTSGRMITSLMPRPGETTKPVTLVDLPAAIAGPQTDGTALADTLRNTLQRSGFFYEAHLAEWFAGRHELAQLREEPQAHVVRRPVAPPEENSPPITQTARPAEATANATPVQPAAPMEGGSREASSMSMVQQQLATLDSGKVQLRIEIWPGQWLDWQLHEQQQTCDAEDHSQTNGASLWHTRVKLDLPHLGTVDAALTLQPEGLAIRMIVNETRSAAALQNDCRTLQSALNAAGIVATRIVILDHDEH